MDIGADIQAFFSEGLRARLRVRASLSGLMITQCQTGSRPCSMTRVRRKFAGATYDNFRLKVLRDPASRRIRLAGIFLPRYDKTGRPHWVGGRNPYRPLPPTQKIKHSSCFWVLVCLYLDGGLSQSQLEDLLQPQPSVSHPRVIPIPSSQ